METAIPVSKRAIAGGGAMFLIKELCNSTAEHVVLAMWLIAGLAVAYMIADEIKRRRNGIK